MNEFSTVRINQAFQSLLYLPLYIAVHGGFFTEQGVRVEITTAGGGPEAWSQVVAGAADYSIHDPIFAVIAEEQGFKDGVVVGTICNGEAILALARDPAIGRTVNPEEFITRKIVGKRVVTQPQPDSQWALLRFLGAQYGIEMNVHYENIQVPIGTEVEPVLAGEADIALAFPPQADLGIARGLYEIFDFSRVIGPFALSCLCSTRSFVRHNPQVHQAIIDALEKSCQYAYAFPDEAVKIAQYQFSTQDPAIIESATRRCLARFLVPRHVFVDGVAWRESQTIAKFVGNIRRFHDVTQGVDNTAALEAFRQIGNLQMGWAGPRPIAANASGDMEI